MPKMPALPGGRGLSPLFFNEDALRKTTVTLLVTQGLLCFFSVPVLVPVCLNGPLVVCARQSCLIDASNSVAYVTFFSMPRGLDPIWKHTSRTSKTWSCKYCNETSHSLKPSYVEEHLAHVGSSIRCCPKVPDHVKTSVKEVIEGKRASKALKKQSDAVVAIGTKAKMSSAGAAMYQASVIQGFRSGQTKEISLAITSSFHSCNIPAHNANAPVFREMVQAIKMAPASYVPPNNAAIDGELLEKLYEVAKTGVQFRVQDVKQFGWSLCSDGMTWLRRGLVNFVLQSATSGPIFLKCVDASAHMADGGTKDAEFIAEQTLEVLDNSELLGFNFKDHFGVIWMDGASNNVLAGKMLESLHDVPEYPWLCVEWCTPHLANVLLGKFGDLDLVSEIIAEGQELFEWFMNHHAQHAMFVAQSDLYYGGEGKGRTLVGGADTRFGKYFSMLVRMLVEKPVLEATVVSKVYNDKKYKDDKIKARILSPEWWAKVAVVSKAVSGILSLIRMGDSNKPTLGMLYPAVIAIEEHLEGACLVGYLL